MAAGLADGVPARGDPAAARLRRVRDPRSVDHRGAHRRHGGAGVPERLPPSWRQGRRGSRDVRERVHLPVPRVVLRPRRQEHLRVAQRRRSPSTTCSRTTSTSRRCGARCGAGARGSTSTTTRRRCGSASSRSPPSLDAWKVESLRTEWWYACRLPVNWKLARRGVRRAVPRGARRIPSSSSPARYAPRDGAPFDPRAFIDADIQYLRTMSEGMAGMVHANDVRIAEGLRDIELPADPTQAMATWKRTLNDAVVRWHRAAGADIPDLNELDARGINEPMGYCFPHYFVLPMYSSASSYRFRPLGPEETLMEIWSLTRFPEGDEPGEAHAARGVGVRRSAVAADPRAGLLEPAAAAEGPAREGLRVHAPVRAGRGTHLELRTDRRRLPRRPSLRAAAPGAAGGQREPASSSRSSTSASEHEHGDDATPRSSRASAPRSPRTPRPSTTAGPTTSSPPSAPTASATSRAWARTTATTPSARPTPEWKPRRPQRHLVVNTLVTDWNDHEATAISDVIFLLQGDSGWAIQVVGRYHDTLHHDDGTWRFHRRAAEFVT